jgi:aldose 1-epimerase
MARTFTLQRPGGIALTVADRGATWLRCQVPMPDGSTRDVVLGRSAPDDPQADKAYLGATVGRYANRIADARIAREGSQWALTPWPPGSRHQLHGGPEGFHARTWEVSQPDDFSLRCMLVSPPGDQGYPGELRAEVTYRLAAPMTIEMDIVATVSAPCPVALTNHSYFNLDGGGTDVREHQLRIAASQYMPVDAQLIPFGPPAPVEGTSFDFRAGKRIGEHWLSDAQQGHGGGYDHAFLLDGECAVLGRAAARLVSAGGDLALEISTSLPALQFYAGQFLQGIPGPGGQPYASCAGLALEPGFLPDSPNHPEWPQPSCWVLPGEASRHAIRYTFMTRG